MAECAVCGAAVSPDQAECPECGASLSQPTASFEPVSGATPSTESAEGSSEGPVLVVHKGPQPGERFFIDRPKLSIGRDPESDIFLNDMTVSRTHAIIECSGGVCTVRDVGSLNGTYVNGDVSETARLAGGDILQIGTFQMIFINSSGDEQR